MAKAKKNRKASSDNVYAKKAKAAQNVNPFVGATPATSKKLNPFEVHVNKEKFQILGRICKHDKGLPGVSRGKAMKKRKETLGQEFREKYKTNKFMDRRIGRYNNGSQLSDDVLDARFLAEKLDQFKTNKASKFNLNDDEVLTHRGQTLEEIEQFRDERSDDEQQEDNDLDANFTESAHFGGDDADGKDRKTVIEEMIVEQKKRKLEIMKEKDEVQDLTLQLDNNYKELMGMVGKMSKSEIKSKEVSDDYDKLLREMVFDPRGVVADKLLSAEELAKKEREELEQLERERLKRMRGDEETTTDAQPKHRSADDLDDGYFVQELDEEEAALSYNTEGKLDRQATTENGDTTEKDQDQDSTGEEEQSEDEAESGEEQEDEQSEDDDLSDLKVSDSESDNENEVANNNEVLKSQTSEKKANVKETSKSKNLDEGDELSFAIDMPSSYEKFAILMKKYSVDNQAIILERLIKYNNPKLDGVNRENVVKLFAFLLQYTNELFTDASAENVSSHFKILDRLNPHMYDLMHLNPEKMSVLLLDVIKEKYVEFRKNPKVFLSLETVVFFKLVSNYFTTSDFRHPVVTPCYIFIQQTLSAAKIHTRRDISLGLFLITILLEYTCESHRFLPAAFNFLLGIVHLSIPQRSIEVPKAIYPFPKSGPLSNLLVIDADVDIDQMQMEEELLRSEDLVTETITTDFKIRALNMTFKMIKDVITIVEINEGCSYLAAPLLETLERTTLDRYPKYVQDNCDETKELLKKIAGKSFTKIVPPEKKPKALRLLEPRFETVYDDKRRPKLSKEKEERVKLMHKLKRETKGAVRELRRDTEYLQKIRIQQQIQSDLERKEKVKRIYQEASVQQGELNELARA